MIARAVSTEWRPVDSICRAETMEGNDVAAAVAVLLGFEDHESLWQMLAMHITRKSSATPLSIPNQAGQIQARLSHQSAEICGRIEDRHRGFPAKVFHVSSDVMMPVSRITYSSETCSAQWIVPIAYCEDINLQPETKCSQSEIITPNASLAFGPCTQLILIRDHSRLLND